LLKRPEVLIKGNIFRIKMIIPEIKLPGLYYFYEVIRNFTAE